MIKTWISLALALLSLAACRNEIRSSIAPLPRGSVGVFGGTPVSASSPVARGIVAIEYERLTGGRSVCTGTMLDHDVVLTAAHCIEGKRSLIKIAFVTKASDFDAIPANLIRRARKVAIPAGYQAGKMDKPNPFDIGLIKLDRPGVSTLHKFLITEKLHDLRDMATVELAGFGMQAYNAVTEQEIGHDHVLKHAAAIPRYPDPKPGILRLDQSKTQGGCISDSGSPVFIRNDDGLVVQGVFTAVHSDDLTRRCRETGVAVSVAARAAWIFAIATQWIQEDQSR